MRTTLALCFLLVASACWGQVTMNNDSSAAASPVVVDNLVWAKTHNVWHLSNHTLSSLSSSANGYMCAQDSSQAVFCFNDYPTNTWTQVTSLGTPHALAVIQAGQFWGLQADSTHCSSNGGYGVDYFNGTSWVYASACLTQIAAASDSTIGGVNSISQLAWVLPKGTGNWVQIPGNYWLSYYPRDSMNGYGIKIDGSVWSNANGIITQIPSSVCTKLGVSVTDLYAICGGGAAYHYSGTAWNQVLGGAFTDLASGGSMNTWVIGPTQSGANLYRLPRWAIQDTFTYTTHTICLNQGVPVSCSQVNPSNPPTHTPNGSFAFIGPQHSGGGNLQGSGGSPDSYLPASATDTMTDPFFCEEGGTECDVSGIAQTQCSMLGEIFTVGVSSGLGGGGSGGLLDCLFKYPRPALPVGWGQTHVTVYIESNDYPSGGTAYTNLCAGISSWAPYNLNTYTCVSSHKPSPFPPSGSFIYVSKNTGPGANTDPCAGVPPVPPSNPGLCPTGTIVKNVWMHINNLASTAHDFLAQGAHEEGHDNFMNNCNWPTAPIDSPPMLAGVCPRGTSVMSEDTLTATHLTAPSTCDIIWYYINQFR